MSTSPNAALQVHELAYSHAVSAAVLAAVKLGIPEAIGDAPMGIGELAESVSADPDALHQLMRALARFDVFCEVGERAFGHSELSRTLRADSPAGRRGMVLLAGAPFAWEIWPRLDDAVRSGRSVFPDIYGKDLHSHLNEDDPETGALFNRAMSKSAAGAASLLAQAVDLGDAATVADIGGGDGTVLRTLLENNPGAQGILFDLPNVVADCDPALRGGDGPGARCRIVPGDAHRDIPVKADAYLLKGVLHMWDDAAAAAALRNLARNAPAGARVLIVEQLMDASASPRVAAVMDLLMLVSQGGRERTCPEFRALVEEAGLVFRGTTPAGPANHLIEAAVA